MAVSGLLQYETLQVLEMWLASKDDDCHNPKITVEDLPHSLLHLELSTTLEQLLRFQSAFVNKYRVSSRVLEDSVSSMMLSVTKQFVYDFLLMLLPSSLASDSNNESGSNPLLQNSSMKDGLCSSPAPSSGEVGPTNLEMTIKEELDVDQLETKPESAVDQVETKTSSPPCEKCACSDDTDMWLDSLSEKVHPKHQYRLTTKAPAAFVYAIRGVKCEYCISVFKGAQCVKDLLNHTKIYHPRHATPQLLRQLKAKNSVKNIIGGGIHYCRCPSCKDKHSRCEY